MFQIVGEFLPIHHTFLTTAVQPFPNRLQRNLVKSGNGNIIFADAIIVIMATQRSRSDFPPLFGRYHISYGIQPAVHFSAFG